MLIDTHAHLFHDDFGKDTQEILSRAYAKGVKEIYLPNLNVSTLPKVLSMSQNNVQAHEKALARCHACIGLHPCYVRKEGWQTELHTLRTSLKKGVYAAIGETGLDAFHDKETLPLQEEALQEHIAWAKQYHLPLILHARGTIDSLIRVIKSKVSSHALTGVFHCFTGTYAQAKAIIDMGFMLGIGGVLTYKNSGDLRALLPLIPTDIWVLETDSPYLSPSGASSRRNEPAYLPLIARLAAKCVGCTEKEVASFTTQNARKLFQQPLASPTEMR